MTDAKHVIRTMCIMLALLASVVIVQVPAASAWVPTVGFTTSLSGSHYILNVSVDHLASPALSTSHYVNWVNITTTNSSGSKWINLTMSGAELYAAQHNETFNFTYDIGSLALNTSISGTAHCTVHGFGAAGTATAGPAPTAAPSLPQNLAAIAGNGYIKLSWSAPATTGASAITNYTLYRGPSAASLTSYKVLGNVTTYNDTAVTNNVTYYYSVTATNGAGESAKSNAAFATPTAGGTTPASPDNTMLILAIVLIVIVVIVIAAVMMMRKKGKAEKPKE